MERLTEHRKNGVILVDISKQKESAIHRLASIEDILGDEYDLDRLETILSQCMTMRQEVAEKMKLVENITVERLREIMEAEKIG